MRATDHEVQTTAAPSAPRALRSLLVAALLTSLGGGSWWLAQQAESTLEPEGNHRLAAAGVDARVDFDGRRGVVHAAAAADALRGVDVIQGLPGSGHVLRTADSLTPSEQSSTTSTPAPTQSPTPEPSTSPTPKPTAPTKPARDHRSRRSLGTVEFPSNGALLDPGDREALDRVVRVLAQHPRAVLRISGNTDDQGADDWGLHLSELRAQNVAAYLVGQGVAADRLVVRWVGGRHPLVSNASAAGRQKNRRVDLLYTRG